MPPQCDHDPAFLAYHDCQGEDRRIHAIVIGVGRYEKPASRYGTKLNSLQGAAIGAYRFAEYLINEFQEQDPEGRRLATLRLMLSPLDRELPGDGALKHGPARRREVAVALREWRNDCNADDQNLAVLYVAGHGVAVGKSSSLLFLAEAPEEASLAYAAVNLSLVERRMKKCAARENLFFYDCCAVAPDIIPDDQEGAVAIAPFQNSKGKQRLGVLCVNAARVGAKTFAIGTDGTLFSRGLLGDFTQGRAGSDALLRTAGELGPTGRFDITPGRLELMLTPGLKAIAEAKKVPAARYEAALTGDYKTAAITRPKPTPTFEVTLRGLLKGRTPPIAVRLLDDDGGTTLLGGNIVSDVQAWKVFAGDYLLEVEGTEAICARQKLKVIDVVDRTVQ